MRRTKVSISRGAARWAARAKPAHLAVIAWLVAAPGLAGGQEDRYAGRCRPARLTRINNPQGTMLWGTRQDWGPVAFSDERRSVLVSVDLERPVLGSELVLRGGRLDAVGPGSGADLTGTVLRGSSSSGQPVEVAICGEEPAPGDGGYVRYLVQAWNPVAKTWENPCARTGAVSDPRAVAVAGVWNGSGARRDASGKFTFACENGAIAKCVRWGYHPWSEHGGQSMAELHQACTRMARADYCGDGRSHTTEGTTIDIYDALGVQSPTPPGSGPAHAFEAAWGPDGATCLAATRSGQPLDSVLRGCAGRFEVGGLDLDGGDRCSVRRKGEGLLEASLRSRVVPRTRPAAGQHTPPLRPAQGR